MKYVVEGVAYTSKKSAETAARELHLAQGRAIQIVQGDSTLGEVQSVTWVGREEYVEPAPVDRTERLAQRREREPGTDLPDAQEP